MRVIEPRRGRSDHALRVPAPAGPVFDLCGGTAWVPSSTASERPRATTPQAAVSSRQRSCPPSSPSEARMPRSVTGPAETRILHPGPDRALSEKNGGQGRD